MVGNNSKRRGGKGNRIKYERGMKLSITIPQYVDDVTLSWINSQPQFATSVWELIRKTAHSEIGFQGQSNNIQIDQLIKFLTGNQEISITNTSPVNNTRQELQNLKDLQMLHNSSSITNKDINVEKASITESTIREKEITEETFREPSSNLIKEEEINISKKTEEVKKVAKKEEKTGIDNEYNLNVMAKNRKGSRPMTRTSGMTPLSGVKANPLEKGIIGDKKQ